MAISNNPYRIGDRVKVKRGEYWLRGTVVNTKLARVFVDLDCASRKTVVDDWHEVREVDPHACPLCKADGPHNHECEGITYEYDD